MNNSGELEKYYGKNTTKALNSEIDIEKIKFFNILKSIFSIFDPGCNGSIDINELDVLGANNNEILNEVLNFIRSNKVLKPINSNSTNRKFLVTFDELVNAADIVLDRRRNKITRVPGHTLSQAFEPHAQNSLPNANSLDLNSLIDKENLLLRQGLDSLDHLKQWYTTQLMENKIKQTNMNKLKYQNLFSIDKLLTDLKQLNDLNSILNDFLMQKKIEPEFKEFNRTPDPPSYQDYLEQFGLQCVKRDNDLDKYLKDKQEKIDSLQKEKANLIRKLFEIKADTENINKNIVKLNDQDVMNRYHSTNNLSAREKEIPIIIDKGFNNKSLPYQTGSYSARVDPSRQIFSKQNYL